MFIQPELRPCQTQSVISIPEQGKHSETHIAKSGVAIFHNPNIPITNYAEDFQTRLEVVSKLVPQVSTFVSSILSQVALHRIVCQLQL